MTFSEDLFVPSLVYEFLILSQIMSFLIFVFFFLGLHALDTTNFVTVQSQSQFKVSSLPSLSSRTYPTKGSLSDGLLALCQGTVLP